MRKFAFVSCVLACLSIVPCLMSAAQQAAMPTPEQIITMEAEQGLPTGWHAVQTTPSTSGGQNIGWFDTGKTLILALNAPVMNDGMLYVRYSRGEKTPSALAVAIAPSGVTKADDPQARQLGVLTCQPTANWAQYQWGMLPLGKLAAGTYSLLLAPQGEKAAVNIDVALAVDDRWQHLWSPSNNYKDGKPADAGTLLPALTWTVEPAAYRGVFTTGDAVTLDVTVANRSAQPKTANLNGKLYDFSGKALADCTTGITVPAGETVKQSVTVAKNLPSGWYALRFTTPGAPSDRLFVVMPPAVNKDRNASRFGLNTHGADSKEDYAMMARLGVGWVRGLTLWHFVQGTNEQPWQNKPFNWADADKNLAFSEAYGLQRMGSFAFSVAWASSKDPAAKNWWGQSFYPPDDLSDSGPYASYVKAAVTRYHDRVKFWEHWNEPDIHFWQGTPEQYVQCLQTAYTAAKSVDPNAVVMNGGFANIGMGNINKMVNAQITKSQDLLAFHAYRSTLSKVWPLKRVYQNAGARLRMWDTECGMEPSMTEDKPFDEKLPWYREQANEVVRAMTLQFACGVERVFWFCYSWEPYAIFSPIGPRPSVMAYRTLSDLIDTPTPAQYVGTLDLGPNARELLAFAFKRNDGMAIVAWKDDTNSPLPEINAQRPKGQMISLSIDAGARVTVLGVDGRQLPATPSQGKLIVPVDNEPVMIRVVGPVTGLTKQLGWTPRYAGPVVASVTFDETPECHQIYPTRRAQRGMVQGQSCWHTDRVNGKGDDEKYYIFLDIPNDLIWELCDDSGRVKSPLQLRVTFLDQGKQNIGIQYGETQTNIQKTDTGQWRTVTADLPNATFPNSGLWASIRITNWGWGPNGEDIYIRKVELIRKDAQ